MEKKLSLFCAGNLKHIGAYMVLPNLVFMILGHFMYFSRSAVVVDYSLAALFFYYVSRIKAWIFLTIILVTDVVFSIAPTYHMHGADWFWNADSVFLMSWPSALLVVVLAIAIFMLIFYSYNYLIIKNSNTSFCNVIVLFMLVVFLLLADMLNGSNINIPSPYNFVKVNIAGSNIHKLIQTLYNTVNSDDKSQLDTGAEITSATSTLREQIATSVQALPHNILVVVVESWGQPISEIAQNLLTSPFDREEIRLRYLIKTGEVPFRGSTVSGEIRELCGQAIRSPGKVNAVSSQMCLPNLLKSMGYVTTAIHGFSRYMFNRQKWYPNLGFERLLFAEDMQLTGYSSRCGHVFRGNCDSDIADYVHSLLSKKSDSLIGISERPQFIYWLTLNTHLPVARDTTIQQKIDCSMLEDSIAHVNHEEPCRLTEVLLGTLTLVADIAERSNGDLHVVIVGDHTPPFIFLKDRNLYKSGVVPFVELIPKLHK